VKRNGKWQKSTVDSRRPVNGHSHISNISQLKNISSTRQEDLFGVGGVFEQNAFIGFATHLIEASPKLLVLDR
jgi:hypothetical protein